MADPGPDSPYYWPGHPPIATWFSGDEWYSGNPRGWVVLGVPPAPWPYVEFPLDRAVYGPTGTTWVFKVSDAASQVSHVPIGWVASAASAILKKFKYPGFDLPDADWVWLTPRYPTEGPAMAITLIKSTIHGKIGTLEEVAHVLHWRYRPPIGEPDIEIIGAKIADAWTTFIAETVGLWSGDLVYDSVNITRVTYAPPAKPLYLVDTVYVPFDTLVKGNSTDNMPTQLALCISHTTGRRGSRYNGRTYLGPLAKTAVDVHGLFPDAVYNSVQPAWRNFLIAVHAPAEGAEEAELEFVVASITNGTSQAVTGQKLGRVPDTMRSRRTSLPESYGQATITV